MGDDVWILGIHMTKFGKHPDKDVVDLGAEAIRAALKDGGVSMKDMGVMAAGNLMGGGGIAQQLQKQVGQTGIPAYNVSNACATGATALRTVIMAVKAGECDMGLAVGVEKLAGAGLLGASAGPRKEKEAWEPTGRFGAVANTDGRIANHEVRLCDPVTGKTVNSGEGEICTRGPEMMLGYTKAEHMREAFDADGYFRTGDLGYYVDGDCICVSGRKKDLIIRGGENISPKEIEDVLHTHPAIKEAAVVAMPHPRLGEGVCAFVIAQPGHSIDVQRIATFLESIGLARQKFPERVELVDDLPRTASGKVQKNVLRERISAQMVSGEEVRR